MGKKEKMAQSTSPNINVIGDGTTIKGDLIAKGDLRLDGVVEGNVETESKFIIGTTGKVMGNIVCANCDVSGNVEGSVKVRELLLIKASGKIDGDIRTSKIVLENGAEFNGNCTMGNAVSIQKSPALENAGQASA